MRQKQKMKTMVDGQIGFEVTPIGSHQKSFYGKTWEYPISGGWELVSYRTKVARIVIDGNDFKDFKVVRLWGGYSATTMRHINAWLQWHHLTIITKKQWEEMEVAR